MISAHKHDDEARLIQTRIPRDVYAWIEEQAGSSGETVAGWLRRTLVSMQGTGMLANGDRRTLQAALAFIIVQSKTIADIRRIGMKNKDMTSKHVVEVLDALVVTVKTLLDQALKP
jgi:adenylylsulfate kinase-like enzyme